MNKLAYWQVKESKNHERTITTQEFWPYQAVGCTYKTTYGIDRRIRQW